MATLGTGTPAPRATGGPAEPAGPWRLEQAVDGFSRARGRGLATQVAAGRRLRVLDVGPPQARGEVGRLRVRLLEDGYPCWIEAEALERHGRPAGAASLPRLSRADIAARLGQVIAWAVAAMDRPNTYLWGGTLGPDFDCSGLVQSAFAQAGIWLPRDAYLQERFCRPVAVQAGVTCLLEPGDLIFFGPARRCTHVGLHLGGGRYLHSSGREHGRNGIGVDNLHPRNRDPVARHYRGQLRGAGRVMHSHDGSPLPA
jgi:cell wall-associated NlpC family hydrolase